MDTDPAVAQASLAHFGGVDTTDHETLLTIGELAEQVGLSPQLLRTWETRFGFPVPTRLPSGHRRYTSSDVRAVRVVVHERDRGLKVEQAIASALRAEDAIETGSVYAALSRRHPTLASYTLTKQTLLALSWAIEDEGTALAAHGLLIGTFQTSRYFGHSRSRWEDLARTARQALVMADFAAHDDTAVPARVALPPHSPLLREWIVVLDSPGLAAALVAWEVPGHGGVPDAERVFEALWSVDGRVVRDAAMLASSAAAALGSQSGLDALQLLDDSPAPVTTSVTAATAVFNRMVAYTDGTVLRSRQPR